MTVIGFNVHRVIMTLERARVKQQQTKTANYELLEEILQGIITGVQDQKHYFQQYVKAANNEGLTPRQTWNLAKEKLRDYVSLKTLYNWAHEILPPEAFDFAQSQRRLLSKKTNAVVTLQPLQEAISSHIECESCVEGYEIEKIRSGAYSYEYLQQVCIWLHETIELNCRGK